MTQSITFQKYICENDPQGLFCFRTAVKALNLMCHVFNDTFSSCFSNETSEGIVLKKLNNYISAFGLLFF